MRKAVGLIYFIGLLGMFRVNAGVLPGDDFNANTTVTATALQQWYSTGSGLWNSTGWWNAANCLDIIETALVATNGRNYQTVISNTFKLNSSGNFLDNYYDDEGWWTVAWIRAYDVTGNAQYLNMAKTIFNDVKGGWNTTCGGGIWWEKPNIYKNAIANELFLLAAIRLHQRTPGDAGTGSYFYWATNEWAWFKASGMINEQNLVNDGLTTNCLNNGETTWTYNQGVIIGGLTELYRTTHTTNYLTTAEAIANATIANLVNTGGILREPCETTGCGGGDVPQFKGIFMRYLALLYDEDHNPVYRGFLFTNAHSIWFYDRNTTNQLGLKWYGPVDAEDAARQSSAMAPIVGLAEPSTALLAFAKGVGGPAFNHSVGRVAGTQAWECGPAISANPGYLVTGPFVAYLPTGSHVAHFRLAVDSITNSAENLVELAVRENNGGATLVVTNLAWSSFKRTNAFQDFALAFPNSTAGDPLEFRVYWYYNPDGPMLTAGDVTIDGALNWTAANLAHDIGRLDGLNAWEADPARDASSGYLVKGPGTAELIGSDYTAEVELKVDNFNYDTSQVATLTVVDADAGNVLVSRSVMRNQFTNTLYQSFALNFVAVAGRRYDVRTYYFSSANAPRLTQRSVVIQPGTNSFVNSIQTGNGSAQVNFSGVPGRTYHVQATGDLNLSWSNIASITFPTNSSTSQFTDTNFNAGTNRFYRLNYP